MGIWTLLILRGGENIFLLIFYSFWRGTLSQVQSSNNWYESSNLTCNLILNESTLSLLVIYTYHLSKAWYLTGNGIFLKLFYKKISFLRIRICDIKHWQKCEYSQLWQWQKCKCSHLWQWQKCEYSHLWHSHFCRVTDPTIYST